jgi:glutathione synthase/RimK-type ligase-like ATP-grasp enzyme
MSPRAAILTPDPADEGYLTRWRDVLAFNAAPLEAAGIAVEGRSWADATDLASFDLVLPLLVWGYPRAHEAWVESVKRWASAGVRLHNPPSVLIWNADKAYLGRLERASAPVVPTLYAERISMDAMEDAVRRFGTRRLVAKPQISSSAWRTISWSPGETLEGGPEGPAMIQPYLPAIEESGEISLFYFGGIFSHAVSKRPQPGDFRVQPEFDGIIAACPAREDELEAAARILAAVEEDLLYARIDLVRGLDGRPALIELELIEPDLYLEYDPAAGAGFAAAALERAVRTGAPPLVGEA